MDHGTPGEQASRPAIIAAFDAADQGGYGPGIALGIFADGAAAEVSPAAADSAGTKMMWMHGAAVIGILSAVHNHGETEAGPPDIPGFPKDWREQIKARSRPTARVWRDSLRHPVGRCLYRTDQRWGARVLSLPDRNCV